MFIIKILLILAIIGLLSSLRSVRRFHKRMKQFREQMNDMQNGGATNGKRQDGKGGARQTKTASGDTIIDNRPPSKANQKIFSKDEGEYVDYKEK